MTKCTHRRLAACERGSSLVEVAVFLPVLLTLLLGIVDFGRAYYQANEVAAAAHAGALFGSQNPSDTSDMETVANDNAPDVSGVSSTAAWGCECSDGTSASVSCATTPSCSGTTEVYYVKVTTTATYSPLIPWPKFGSSYTLSSAVEMRATP
jgi:Flp pilus assembly protein TadG